MPNLYDRIGSGYALARAADPHIARLIWEELGDASSVLNVGAGAGSYEPVDRNVVAVEPSAEMRAQRKAGAAPCVEGVAEALPFPDRSFDVAMSVASHWHWPEEARGFAEMRRVARKRVVVQTVDRPCADRFWLTREYLPDSNALWRPAEETASLIGSCKVVKVPIPADCADGFFHAYWRRPHAYLDEGVRSTMAVFARLDPAETEEGIARLERDLESGEWHSTHRSLLEREALDLGCRLLVYDCEGDERGA